MQSPQNPSGSKLQWWQEQATTARSKWYQDTVETEEPLVVPQTPTEVASAPKELWDELEAEAVRRADQETQRRSQEWLVPINYNRIIEKRTRRLVVLVGIITAIYSALAAMTHSLIPLFAILAVAVFALFARQMMIKRLKKQRRLQIGISPFGISFEGPNFDGVINWNQLRSVERRKISGQKFMIFHVTDPAIVEKFQYTAQGEKLRRAGKKWEWLAKIQKLDMHAVYLPEDVLPIEPEAFMTRIATAQTAARIPAY